MPEQRTVFYVATQRPLFGWNRLVGPFHARGPANAALWQVIAAGDGGRDDADVIDDQLSPGQVAELGSMNDRFPPETITTDYVAKLEWQRDRAAAYHLTLNTPAGYQRIRVEHRAGDDDTTGGWAILTGEPDTPLIFNRDGIWEPDVPRAGWRDEAFSRRTLFLVAEDALDRVRALDGVNIDG